MMKRMHRKIHKYNTLSEEIDFALFYNALKLVRRLRWMSRKDVVNCWSLCRDIRHCFIKTLDPNLLTSEQLKQIASSGDFVRFLQEINKGFSKTRALQWFRSYCPGDDEHGAEEDAVDGSLISDKEIETAIDLALQQTSYRLLDPREDYLGYKIVEFCAHPNGDGKFDDVTVLLHLQLPGKFSRIYTSDGTARGEVVQVLPPQDGLNDGQKYNTNCCIVTGVQFFGRPKAVREALLNFQQNAGFLVSGFGGANKMCYELGYKHVEPRAGQVVKGQTCTAGLHFFRDEESALKYAGMHRNRGIPHHVISLRLTKPRGVVVSIKTPKKLKPVLTHQLPTKSSAFRRQFLWESEKGKAYITALAAKHFKGKKRKYEQ